MQRLRASALFLVLALGLVLWGRAALANHGAAGCSVSPNPVFQGGTITVTGSTNVADQEYVVRLDGSQIDSGTTDEDTGEVGHFRETHILSSSQSTVGSHTIVVDPEAGADLTCTFTVNAATPSPTPTATATATPTATPRDTDEPDDTDRPAREPRGAARLNVLGDDKFKRGELVKVTGARMTPNENYNLDFAQSPGTIVARGTSNRLGSVRFEFKIPSNARTGPATLTAIPADGSGLQASARITIEGGSAGGGSGGGGKSLPATGRNVAVYTTLAMLLLLGGLSMQRYEWLRGTRSATSRHVNADKVTAVPPKLLWS